jgi:hypothetical protein
MFMHKCVNRKAFGQKARYLSPALFSGEKCTYFFTVSERSNPTGDGTGTYRNDLFRFLHRSAQIEEILISMDASTYEEYFHVRDIVG